MRRPSEDDLFKDSTMSFGEHLDELRGALVRSVIALTIGVTVGFFWLGDWVVARIQDPFLQKLQQYYLVQVEDDLAIRIESLEKAGQPVPKELRDPKYARQLAFGEGMLFEERFIDPRQLADALKQKFPEQMRSLELPRKDEISVPEAEADTLDNKTATPKTETSEPAAEATNQNAGSGLPKKDDMLRLFVWHLATDDNRIKMKAFNAQEPFMIKIKASLLAGTVLASPAIFYFLWSFVAAGLYPHEKKYVHIFLPFSLGLFLGGALLAFFYVIPPMLDFFFGYNKALGIEIEPRISEWIDLALMLPVAFGASFQLPLVMLFLQRIGIFTVSSYLASWRMSVLVMAIVAMVITPTGDPQTMLMMLVPLSFLYFGGILLCKWMPGPKSGDQKLSTGG
jgi:sec-independent protein translocase protein TatC